MSDPGQPVEPDFASPPPTAAGEGEGFELGYVVALDQFSGPMDLLLYLVRRTELDIVEIPIATITDQFVATVHLWKGLDLDVAGDFIVMAATLLELKARQLAPPPETTDGAIPDEPDEVFDPRSDLIQRLLAYRRFKDASQLLDGLQEDAAGRFGRQLREAIPEDPDAAQEIHLEDLDVHALFRSYELIMARINGLGPRRVVFDEVPMNVRVQKLLETLQAERTATLQHYLAREPSKLGQAGVLVAALECVRQRFMEARQLEQYGAVDLRWRDDAERTAVLTQPPEEIESGGRRRRRLPLVTWTPRADAPAEASDDGEAEAEEGAQETDEARFLRELDESCDLSAVLARGSDIEASFAAHWAIIRPPPSAPPPPVDVPAAAVDVVSAAPIPVAPIVERPRRKPREGAATTAPAEVAPAPEGGAAPASDGVPADAIAAPVSAVVPSGDAAIPQRTTEPPDSAFALVAPPLPSLDLPPSGTVESQSATSIVHALAEAAPIEVEPSQAPSGIAGLHPADQPDLAAVAVAPTPVEPARPDGESVEASEPVAEAPPIPDIAAPLPADPLTDTPSDPSPASALAIVPDPDMPRSTVAETALDPTASAERVWAAAEAALAHDEAEDDEAGDDPAAANAALLGERRRPLKDETWFAPGADEDDEEESAEDDVAAANAALLAEQRPADEPVPAASAALAGDESSMPANDDSPVAAGARLDDEVIDDEDGDHDPGLIAALAEALPSLPRHDQPLGAETLGRLAALIPDAAIDDADDAVDVEAAPAPSVEPATTPDDGETVVRIAAMASQLSEADDEDVDSTPADRAGDPRPTALPAPGEAIEPAPTEIATEKIATDVTEDQPEASAVADPTAGAAGEAAPRSPGPTPVDETGPSAEPAAVLATPASEPAGLDSIEDSTVLEVAAHAAVAADVDAITAITAAESDPVTPALVALVPTEPDASETVVRLGALAAFPAADPDLADAPTVAPTAHSAVLVHPAPAPSAPSADEDVVRVASRAGDPALDDGDEPAPTTVPDDHETVMRIAAVVGHDDADPGDEDGPPADVPPDPPDGPPPSASPPPVLTALTETTPTDTAPMPAPPITRIRPWLLIAASLALVNALGWFGYVWLVRLPRAVLEVSTPAAVLPGEAWTWRFNLDVVADVAVNATPEQVPTIEPAVPGAWTWRDKRTLEFAPTENLPPATTFLVRLRADDLRSASGFRLAQDLACAVRTPPLRVEGVRQVTFSSDNTYTVELAFDRPVDPAALAGRIIVEPPAGGDRLPVTTTTPDRNSTLRLTVGPSKEHNGHDMRVRLKAAPAGPAGLDGPLRLDPSWSAVIGLGHRLALREAVANTPTRGDPTITLRFADREVPLTRAIGLVRVVPAVPFAARAAGGAVVLTGAFVPGETYEVVVDAAWPEGAADEPNLPSYPAAGKAQVAVGDRVPGAWFGRDGERLRLGAVNLGSATLAIVAANGDQVGSHLLDLAGARNATTMLDLATDDLLAGLPPGDYRLVLAASVGELATASVAVRDAPLSAQRLASVIDRWTSALAAGDAAAQPILRLTIPGP